MFVLICSDESKAGPFKALEKFAYVGDTISTGEPSFVRKFLKCWTQGKLSSPVHFVLPEATCVWGILDNTEIFKKFWGESMQCSPPQFCDPLRKHNRISQHQVPINGKNNTLKKSPRNNVFQPAVKSSNLFVLLHICIIGQTRNSL